MDVLRYSSNDVPMAMIRCGSTLICGELWPVHAAGPICGARWPPIYGATTAVRLPRVDPVNRIDAADTCDQSTNTECSVTSVALVVYCRYKCSIPQTSYSPIRSVRTKSPGLRIHIVPFP